MANNKLNIVNYLSSVVPPLSPMSLRRLKFCNIHDAHGYFTSMMIELENHVNCTLFLEEDAINLWLLQLAINNSIVADTSRN